MSKKYNRYNSDNNQSHDQQDQFEEIEEVVEESGEEDEIGTEIVEENTVEEVEPTQVETTNEEPVIAECILQTADEKNRNVRYYSEEVIKKVAVTDDPKDAKRREIKEKIKQLQIKVNNTKDPSVSGAYNNEIGILRRKLRDLDLVYKTNVPTPHIPTIAESKAKKKSQSGGIGLTSRKTFTISF